MHEAAYFVAGALYGLVAALQFFTTFGNAPAGLCIVNALLWPLYAVAFACGMFLAACILVVHVVLQGIERITIRWF